MKLDHVITLEDNKKYLLLDKTELDNKNYFYAVEVAEIDSEPTENYIFLEEIIENNEVYVEPVEDEETKAALLVIFMNNLGLELDKSNQ